MAGFKVGMGIGASVLAKLAWATLESQRLSGLVLLHSMRGEESTKLTFHPVASDHPRW
jgi:hypothetical protein